MSKKKKLVVCLNKAEYNVNKFLVQILVSRVRVRGETVGWSKSINALVAELPSHGIKKRGGEEFTSRARVFHFVYNLFYFTHIHRIFLNFT